MKKSTLAIAALLTTLSTATIVPAAFAEETTGTEMSTCQGGTGCKGCQGCMGCKGCQGCLGCKGCQGCSGCKGS